MKTKDSWIDETLNSLDGIGRATADPDIFLKVQSKREQGDNTGLLRQPWSWSVAAAIALLISLNIFGVLYYKEVRQLSQEVPAALAADYLSYLEPIKL